MKIIKHEDNQWIVKIDPDEEILQVLGDFFHVNNIGAGTFSAIGAVKEVTLSYFDLDQKKYLDKALVENMEIANLCGNVSMFDGKRLIHAHGVFADSNFGAKAGHVKRAVVSVTAEVAINAMQGEIERKPDQRFGLNLLS